MKTYLNTPMATATATHMQTLILTHTRSCFGKFQNKISMKVTSEWMPGMTLGMM